jgi:hypothetical protein
MPEQLGQQIEIGIRKREASFFLLQRLAINGAHGDENFAQGLTTLGLDAQGSVQPLPVQEAQLESDLTERSVLLGLNAEDFEDLAHGQMAGLDGELADRKASFHLLVQRLEHLLRRHQTPSHQMIAHPHEIFAFDHNVARTAEA